MKFPNKNLNLKIVIHRTIWSIDNHRSRSSGLGPFIEHDLLVMLYSYEADNLELTAKDLVEEDSVRAAKFVTGSVHISFIQFYH
jgi:hypothetical protein